MGHITWMMCTGSVAHKVSCAILSGGSAAIVFAAIAQVKSAEGTGIPTAQAAAMNAPMFTSFSKIALYAGIVLLVSECLNFAAHTKPTKLTVARYASSMLCVATTIIFAIGIIPPMEKLRPLIKDNEQAYREFHKLHELSRAVFSGTIMLAFISLVLPSFELTNNRQ